MTSTRKVKLQDRGTPEPRPSRKVVLDELLRSLQDLVTNELAVDVSLDDSPAAVGGPATAATMAPPASEPAPAPTEPKPPRSTAAAPLPGPNASGTAPEARTAIPAVAPATAAVRESGPESADLIIEELVAGPVAEPTDIAAPAAPDSRPAEATPVKANPAAAAVEPKGAQSAGRSRPLELALDSGPLIAATEPKALPPAGPNTAKGGGKSRSLELAIDSGPLMPPTEPRAIAPTPPVGPDTAKGDAKSRPVELAIEPGPVSPTPKHKWPAPAAVVEPEMAKVAPQSSPPAPANGPEVAATAPERRSTAPDPGTAQPRRGRLGDTVVLTPPRDIPPPPKAAPDRGARPAVVETPVPLAGLQQQLPYLDLSPAPAGNTAQAERPEEPGGAARSRPATGQAAGETPAAKGDRPAGRSPMAEPDFDTPNRPSTGAKTPDRVAPSPTDRASVMASDGPDELPGLDHSAVPAAAATRLAGLAVADDDTGPSDIPLLEDAIDLDEHIELSSALRSLSATPPARAATGDPRRLAIQLAARLNVELRREGKPVLGGDVIAKLARLLEESLAKGAPNMENTRPKKP